ncbi:MAG: hypothetical protein QOE29_876, partial [Gaiellaceae bacterium]|nr:hypothetical protein [Gaiellaceae bacterium]
MSAPIATALRRLRAVVFAAVAEP